MAGKTGNIEQGKRLKAWRDNRPMIEVSKMARLDISLLGKYERGNVMPSMAARIVIEQLTDGAVRAADW